MRAIPHRRFSSYDARALSSAGSRARRARLRGYSALGSAAPQVPAAWQTDPKALLALAAQAKGKPMGRLGRLAYFRGFGLSPTATSVAETVAPKAASAAASALVAGAAAGPIGVAAGAVVALALTLFQKNYFNVADANAACATEETLWQKYLAVQGHVAGRALGWPTMQTLMHAATGAGLFPLNSQHLTFHEGTLQCAGNGAWVDSFLSNGLGGTSCSQHNCMADALAKYKTSTVPSGTPDAVYFIDNIVLPMNAGDSIPWINSGASNPQVHQMLYDLADAYLDANNVASTPYVQYPAAPTPAPTATPAPATSSPPAATTPAPAAAPTMPKFPGFSTAIAATDARLNDTWAVSDASGSELWTPTGNGFFSSTYGGGTAQIQVAISGNSILGLRQDSDGSWAKYTGTFDSTGYLVSGSEVAYTSDAPAGITTNWTGQIQQPQIAAAPAAVASAPMAAPTMSSGTTQPTSVNVTVSAPATPATTAAPASSSNTLLWVALAGVGALALLSMQHGQRR
jgi:cell division septation protein DedD